MAAAFERRYGRAPAGVWSAPGRVNVIGEHVDYNDGLCLPFALPQRTFVALSPRDDGQVRLHSQQSLRAADGEPSWAGALDEVGPGTVPGWAAYAAGVAWALRSAGVAVPGFDAVVDGQVPVGAGLSSSAALECAVAVALDELTGTGWGADDAGRSRLAAACVRAENEIAGAPTGGMDQAAALRSRAGRALVLDCRDFTIEQVPLALEESGLQVLVIDTRAHHSLVDGQYGSRRQACELACRALGVTSLREVSKDALPDALHRLWAIGPRGEELVRRARHVVTEIARVRSVADLLRHGQVHRIGPLLDASHASLRDDYEVSCRELDLACEAALAAGALGARMTGGGFGGSAIALVRSESGDDVAAAVAAGFAAAGLTAPRFLRAVPSGAAGRDR